MEEVRQFFDEGRAFLDAKLDFVAAAICARKREASAIKNVEAFEDNRATLKKDGRANLDRKDEEGLEIKESESKRPVELVDKIVFSLAATWSIFQVSRMDV